MAALDELPFETLEQILSSLSTADLIQTSLVCRQLSAVSVPLLYKSPRLVVVQARRYPLWLERFIKTLIYSPRQGLSTHVRSVGVYWDRSTRLDPDAYPVSIWPTAFYHPAGFHGIHCTLLLHLLPSVRELEISPPRDLPGASRGYLSHCLKAPQGSPATPTLQLQLLRTFSCPYAVYHEGVPHSTSRGGITFRAVLALMHLPCIESIDTHMTNIPTVPPPSSTNPVRFSSVTSLRLSAVRTVPLSLAVLLRAPVALTRFWYVAVHYSSFAISDFTAALSPLRASLKYLHFDLIRTRALFTAENADTIRGSVHLWPVLHTLRCSTRDLLGYPSPPENEHLELAEVLPRCLRQLEISMDQFWRYEYAVDKLVNMMMGRDDVVPLLESVAMDIWWSSGEPIHQRLRGACMEAGVELLENGSFTW